MGPPFQCSRDSGVLGIGVTRLCGVRGAGRVQRWGGEEGQQENGGLEEMRGAQRVRGAQSWEAEPHCLGLVSVRPVVPRAQPPLDPCAAQTPTASGSGGTVARTSALKGTQSSPWPKWVMGTGPQGVPKEKGCGTHCPHPPAWPAEPVV